MILVAIGANLSTKTDRSPKSTCDWAIGKLRCIAAINLVSFSPWYVSAPIPASEQPPYINGMARLEGEPDPAWLLAQLHAIEAATGRAPRKSPNHALSAARTLDLDLIDVNGQISTGPDLILPHPRAHLRAFVLLPLRDVAPDWVHPTLGRTAAELIARLPPQQIEPLAPGNRIA